MQTAPGEDLLRRKLAIETRLFSRSGHPFACVANSEECIAAYAELLVLDWDKSRLARGLPVVVAADASSAAGREQLVLSLRSSAAEMETILGVASAPMPGTGNELPGLLDAPYPVEQIPRTCGDSQAFYDQLFARNEVRATIVFGYLDQHLESIRAYVRHVLLKLEPIPVLLCNQEKFHADTRSLFVGGGFVEESSAPTELQFSRKFYYGQRLKTLRVRVLFSIARCPGEAMDKSGRLWRYDNQTCPEQQRATAYAKAQFVDSFATSAIVVYHGHSRYGRGLDFGPMSLGDGRLALDCGSLPCAQGNTTQTLLYISGCDSVRHYGSSVAQIRGALPTGRRLAWLGVDGDSYTSNAAQTSLRLMNMLVEAKCPQQILTILNLPRHDPVDHSRVRAEGF